MQKLTCPHCGYEWTPRKEAPKSCPACKQYLQRRTVKNPWNCGGDRIFIPICTTHVPDLYNTSSAISEEENNQNLIAAAPELYEALRESISELNRAYEWMLENNKMSEVISTQRESTINKGKLALAKAEGK